MKIWLYPYKHLLYFVKKKKVFIFDPTNQFKNYTFN